jgi:SAM-dependent methyltransferase
VPTYAHFARHYDAVVGSDPLGNGARVRGHLERHAPGASSLLELGCGSGQILAALPGVPSLIGVDRSPQMLALARRRVPRARLLEAEIDGFDLGERVDAAICVFDTLNHLADLERWRALFARVAAHLRPGGLFAFDVNTIGQLRRLAHAPPWTLDVPGARVSQHVEWVGGGRAHWHVAIDEGADRHHERIVEFAVPLATLVRELERDFEALECVDGVGAPASDDSRRAYLAWRRR